MGPNYYVTPAPPNSGLDRKMIFVGAGLVVAILLGIFLLLGSGGGKSIATHGQHLKLRLGSLVTLLNDTATTRNIKNEELSKLITDYSLILDTDLSTVSKLLAPSLPAKYDAQIVATETDTSSAKKLEEAGINNRLDAEYADILLIKTKSLRALIAETMTLSRSSELTEALKTTDKHLLELQEQVEKLKL